MSRKEMRKFTKKEKKKIYTAIFNLIEQLGSQSELGKILGITQPWVSCILNGAARVDVNKCILLDKKYGVPKEVIRPDVDW